MLSQTVPIPQGWRERLEFVTFALNISPHQETGESGFFLMFARDARFPTEVTEAMTFSPYTVDLDDFRSIIMQNIGNAVQNVRAALDKSRERAKKYYDERNKSKAEKYCVGQRVMVFDPSIPNTVANKLSWKYFGPFRILGINNNNAKVLPVDKPLAEPQLVPLDRLCPIPVEVPPISYARKPNKSKIIVACLTVLNRPLLVTTVELNVAAVREEIPLHPYAESEEKDRFVSKEKDVVLFTAYEANGLGPFYECGGRDKCTPNCSEVPLSEVVPSLPDGSTKSAKVPSLGHQVYLAALSRRYDGTDLEEKVKAVLKCPAADLAKSFSSICAGAETPEITHEIILSQARIRHLHCDRLSSALIQSVGMPLKMVGATAVDHPLFSELTFAKSRLIHAGVGDNIMGEIWEEIRHGAGKPLVASPFIALTPPGDKALVRGQHMTVEDTADLLAANFYLQQHAFSGAVQLIILVLPPTTPQCPARLDALLATVRSFGHVQLFIAPPPPSIEPSYRAIVMKLLAAADQPHLRATDVGRSIFELGFFGRLPDRRFVDVKSGKWSDPGRALLRQHLLEVSALRPIKFYQRPGPPPPPQPTIRSQVFKVAPQQPSRKRQFQPEPPKPQYYAKQPRKQ
ncbi:gagpol and env protein precursor [Aphelenchoides avenae]|nr:gagpol and env protein precursor [Aphelenchus avenae]